MRPILSDVESVVGLIGRIEGVVSVVDRLRYRVDERLADSWAAPFY